MAGSPSTKDLAHTVIAREQSDRGNLRVRVGVGLIGKKEAGRSQGATGAVQRQTATLPGSVSRPSLFCSGSTAE